jgi:hypothetical protein
MKLSARHYDVDGQRLRSHLIQNLDPVYRYVKSSQNKIMFNVYKKDMKNVCINLPLEDAFRERNIYLREHIL